MDPETARTLLPPILGKLPTEIGTNRVSIQQFTFEVTADYWLPDYTTPFRESISLIPHNNVWTLRHRKHQSVYTMGGYKPNLQETTTQEVSLDEAVTQIVDLLKRYPKHEYLTIRATFDFHNQAVDTVTFPEFKEGIWWRSPTDWKTRVFSWGTSCPTTYLAETVIERAPNYS